MLDLIVQAPLPVPTLGGTAVIGYVLIDLVIILVMARLVGGLFVRIGQPRVVGEIVAGVLLGPTLFGAASFELDSSWFAWDTLNCIDNPNPGQQESLSGCIFPAQARVVLGNIGQIALVFFMFLVGLELNFKSLKGRELGIGIVGVGVVILPVLLGIYLVGPVMYDSKFVGGFGTAMQPTELAFGLMIAAMLSVTAFPVMARILQEKGLTTSAMGAIGIAAAAIVTVMMFMVVSVASSVAKIDPATGSRVDSNFDIALNMAYVLIYVAVMMFAVRPILGRTLGPWYERRGFNSEVFAIVLIIVFASAYVAHQLDVNVIVGGFLAGAALPSRESLFADMSSKLAEVTGTILLPVFLAFSGLVTDFTRLEFNMALPIAIFLVAGIAGKWLGGAVFARAGGLTWPEGNVIGILMNCRGLLVLVVGLIAFQAGVITAPMQVAGVLMALITTAMTGPLFDAFLPMATKDKPPGGPTVVKEAPATT